MQHTLKVSSSQTTESILGEPLPIILVNENAEDISKRIKLSIKNLRRIFLDPRVINSKLMIVSIDGSQRTGKSFFMNICIRYLQKRRVESLIANQDSMSGFAWRTPLDNTGFTIYIWSEPYIIESSAKTKVAILLLDCDGCLSNKMLYKETFIVYALLQILSSLQIYNIFSEINESHLQWLAIRSEFSNISKHFTDQEYDVLSCKPYQTICILIRDWPYPYEFFYGAAGGQQYLNRYLSVQFKGLPEQNILLRQFLNSQYNNINCFLMPHIQMESSSNSFDGRWDELSNEFQEHVLGFMKTVFSSQNLCVKEICGQSIIGRDMLSYIENYFNTVISIDNPIPHSGFDACAKKHHYYVFDECLEHYNQLMIYRHLNSESAVILLAFHDKCKILAIQKFDDNSKFGTKKYSEHYRAKLESQIDENFIRFFAMNSSHPLAITRLLSIIVLSIIFLTTIGLISRICRFTKMQWVSIYAERFTFNSVILLTAYCLITIKKIYSQLNINLEIQTLLRNQFLS